MNTKFSDLIYGLRGTILKYISAISIIPLILALICMYFVTRYSIIDNKKQDMENVINNIKNMSQIESDTVDKNLVKNIKEAYEIARREMASYPVPGFSNDKKNLTVTNQDTGETTTIETPVLTVNGISLLENTSIVDRITERIAMPGASATIFQFSGDKMIRISTNVRDASGKRATLSYISKESTVYQTIAEGKSYEGRAVVVGKWSITRYEPIRDRNDAVIGALYVGVPAPDLGIFQMVRSTRIGKAGYITIINSQGQIIDHPFLDRGKLITEMKDAVTGRPLCEDVVKQKEGSFVYFFRDKEGSITKKLAYATYFPKWDWIIMANISYDDMFSTLYKIFRIMIILLIGLPVILALISNFLALRITRPFRRIIDVAVQVSKGDLTIFIRQTHYKKCVEMKNCTNKDCPAYNSRNLACWKIDGTLCGENGKPCPAESKREEYCKDCVVYRNAIRSEMDELIEAINEMIVTTQVFVHEMKDTTDELTKNSDDLARISKKMEEESQLQASSIEETTSANEELLATIESVAHSAEQQADRVSQTSAAMEELTSSTRLVGESSMNVSKTAKNTVTEARNTEGMLRDTTTRINQVAESSKKIVDIVAMINDISDQINLLSLNAAIEAARAGDHGKGFAVVSEEISKLADATAQSTKEIENVIKGIRLDIEKGATLVNKTNDAISEMIQKIDVASSMIEEIALSSDEQIKGSEQVMSDVEEINRMSEQIATATSEQKVTSAEILKALTRINDSIQEIAGSTITVAESAASLKEKSEKLTSITGHFKV